ncbi:putative alpha-galactosidase B [Senna tora]|uniref:alpha-galactosidase n=1 Tax=Senna tora TaxID=362788 RepID=A0A834X8J3_9FABA|nr:putative alpha-galactosidase B [Senna tora]
MECVSAAISICFLLVLYIQRGLLSKADIRVDFEMLFYNYISKAVYNRATLTMGLFESVTSKNISENAIILPRASFPPRGWNSYDSFCWTISEEEFLQSAKIISQRLHVHGYEYVVVDYLWYRRKVPGAYTDSLGFDVIDEWGRMIPDPGRWPSSKGGTGFKEVADKVHSMGLKFGIHVMRGISTQAVNANTPILDTRKGGTYQEYGKVWRAKDIAIPERACAWMPHGFMSVNTKLRAGRAFLRSLYEQYASWGVDFVKHDCVFGDDLDLSEITYVSEILSELDRPIVYSLSPGTSATPAMAKEVSGLVNMYRITGDDWDTWGDVTAHFDVTRDFSKANMIGAQGLMGNSWPDLDMLPLGWLTDPGSNEGPHRYSRLNLDEQKTQFPFITSSKKMNIHDQDLMRQMRGSKRDTPTSYTYLISLTGCTESRAVGWSIESLNQDVERICWKRNLGDKHQAPFCVHKREIRVAIEGTMSQEDYRGKHHLVAANRMKFCLDASPKRKLTSKEFKRGTFSPCKREANQMWELNPNGTLVNSYSSLCATVDSAKVIIKFKLAFHAAETYSRGVRSWIAKGRKGEVYVAFFNLNEQKTVISAKTSDLARVLPGRDYNSCKCTEVWSKRDIRVRQGSFSIHICTHPSRRRLLPPTTEAHPVVVFSGLHLLLSSCITRILGESKTGDRPDASKP